VEPTDFKIGIWFRSKIEPDFPLKSAGFLTLGHVQIIDMAILIRFRSSLFDFSRLAWLKLGNALNCLRKDHKTIDKTQYMVFICLIEDENRPYAV
jgi:hypothetical protein